MKKLLKPSVITLVAFTLSFAAIVSPAFTSAKTLIAPKKIAPVAPLYAPNNLYYINSAGTKIHSPTYAPLQPSGASARCRDGTYSFSASRRGTCSHHGGVSRWY